MAKKATPSAKRKPSRVAERPPVLVRCSLRIPKENAEALIPRLGIALDCGGAAVTKKRNFVEIETILEISSIAAIVEKGVAVLVTERVIQSPVPAREFSKDAESWFKEIERLK